MHGFSSQVPTTYPWYGMPVGGTLEQLQFSFHHKIKILVALTYLQNLAQYVEGVKLGQQFLFSLGGAVEQIFTVI